MKKEKQQIVLHAEVSEEFVGLRLDQALASLFPEYSRTCLKNWILAGCVILNGTPCEKAKDKVSLGDRIVIEALLKDREQWEPESIPLDVVFEDESLLIINKGPNFVVHPAAGNWTGTLVNALLHYHSPLKTLPRAGLIHRLDKDTTGLLVVAKTLTAQQHLVKLLQERKMKRIYEAIVNGVVLSGGTIEAPIGRHPKDRRQMAVRETGKPAVTHYRVIQRFTAHTHLRVELETGRTHQIRVHLAHRRYPIVGDKLYGGRFSLPAGASDELREALQQFSRQALHACQLALTHPVTGEYCEWKVPLPEDMQHLLSVLQNNSP